MTTPEPPPAGRGHEAGLYRVGYVSTQSRPMAPADLVELLNTIRERNRKMEITGLLLHREDSFFQVLEGSEKNVLLTLATIRRDQRHQRLQLLFEEPCESREFPDWRMGFLELDNVDARLLPGFSSFLTDDFEPRQFLRELTRSKRLALLFRGVT